ncbi:putative F-box domain-containing protein [Medicago truncatula]|uniref:F-box and associated interaction domain protein n=1 Tax=Medicago truncatula TaxID=3880 RepID=G7L4Q5_MEDTR|nr:F-box and associated interaction domain protein [Medicago truncatula]RHN46973.1 putative F-box domain-containing protein [Medicago truncatula]
MDVQSAKKSRPLSRTVVVLPDDLITEILPFLPVKSILQFRCVSESWKSLTSNPSFVKLHLNRSASRNPQFTIVTLHKKDLFRCFVQISFELGYSVLLTR